MANIHFNAIRENLILAKISEFTVLRNDVFFLFQLFYMIKGDMCLKVVEQGKHRDVPIKEGEVTSFIYLRNKDTQHMKNIFCVVIWCFE